jgi:hypothetical protein
MLNPRIGLFIVVFFAVIQFILFCIALHHFLFKHPRVNDEITISHVLRCHRELVMADAAAKRKTSQNEAMNSNAPQNAHSTGGKIRWNFKLKKKSI